MTRRKFGRTVFNGKIYGPLGFSVDDGVGVCFSYIEEELNIIENTLYKHKGSNGYLKSYLYVRDQMTCKYCTDYVTYKEATIDHYYPPEVFHIDDFIEYNRVTNLVIACRWCNFVKGKQTPDIFPRHNKHDNSIVVRVKKLLYGTTTEIRLRLQGTKTILGVHKGRRYLQMMNDEERMESLRARFRQSY